MCTHAVCPSIPKGMLLGSTPFIIPTHHQPGRVGHNSDRSITHNDCSSAFFFLSNYYSLKYNQWYCAWLFVTLKFRPGTWQSLQVLMSREQICSTLVYKSTADLQLVWTQDPSYRPINASINVMPYYSPYGKMMWIIWWLIEESGHIVGNLITSEDASPVISHLLWEGFDYRVCSAIGAPDISNPQLASLWLGRGVVGHNVDSY